MLERYRDSLNTLNWAFLGIFLLGTSYTLLGTESIYLIRATEFLWEEIFLWSPFVIAFALVSLYAEIRHVEEDEQAPAIRFLSKPAPYVLAFVFMVLTAISFS